MPSHIGTTYFKAVIKRPTVFCFQRIIRQMVPMLLQKADTGYGPMGRGFLMSQGCVKHLFLPTFPPGTCPQI